MSFELAKKDGEFWSAYYENVDERETYKDEKLTPEEFYEVWIDRLTFEKKMENRK